MPALSDEDNAMWKEATKHYNRLKLYEHRLHQTDLTIKIQLRDAALAALPGAFRPFLRRSFTCANQASMCGRHADDYGHMHGPSVS